MKRLLAMIMSFIFALTNNTGYVASEKPLFGAEKYYMFEDESSFTEQELISRFNKTGEQSITTSIPVGSAKIVQGDVEHRINGYYFYTTLSKVETIDPEVISTLDNEKGQFKWNDANGSDVYIVSPCDCHVVTDFSTDNSGGRDLALESTDKKFRFEFSNLERRFTEIQRTPPPDGEDWKNCAKISKDYTLPAGYLVGIAQAGTQLTIKVSSDEGTWLPCTLDQLYFKQ